MQVFIGKGIRQWRYKTCSVGISGNDDRGPQWPLVGFEPRFQVVFCDRFQRSLAAKTCPGVRVLAEKSLHKEAYRIGKIVLTQSLDPGNLKDLLFFDVLILKAGLLQDLDKDVEGLI